jgi:PAS domain S-box-containing protein
MTDLSNPLYDTTQPEQPGKDLLCRQQEFRALVENNPDLISRFDRELRYLYINPALERFMERPISQVVGKTMSEVGLSPDRIAFWTEHLSAVFATGEEHQFETENRWPHAGRHFAIALSLSVERTARFSR